MAELHLNEVLLGRKSAITASLLSLQLQVPLVDAEAALGQFYEKHRGELDATWVLSGKTPTEHGYSFEVRLVSESDVESAKAGYDEIGVCKLYSLSRQRSGDGVVLAQLAAETRDLKSQFAVPELQELGFLCNSMLMGESAEPRVCNDAKVLNKENDVRALPKKDSSRTISSSVKLDHSRSDPKDESKVHSSSTFAGKPHATKKQKAMPEKMSPHSHSNANENILGASTIKQLKELSSLFDDNDADMTDQSEKTKQATSETDTSVQGLCIKDQSPKESPIYDQCDNGATTRIPYSAEAPKRKRKMTTRTIVTKDEDGFDITRIDEVWESSSDKEGDGDVHMHVDHPVKSDKDPAAEAVSAIVPKASESKKASAPLRQKTKKVASQKKSQASLMSFFQKRS